MLSHFTEPKFQKNWATYVPFVQLAINSAKHTALNASPSSLLLSREIRLPHVVVCTRDNVEGNTEYLLYTLC